MTSINEPLWTKYEAHLRNEQLTQKRIRKLRSMYVLLHRTLNVPITKATRPDFERLNDALNKGKVMKSTRHGPTTQPLSASTRSDLKKFIKSFYRWYAGANEQVPDSVSWLRARIAKDQRPQQKDTITLEEVRRLAEEMKNPEYSIMTLLLFDSGFRIGEFYTIRKSDLVLEPFDKDEKCWWVSCRDSKTQVRKIPVPLFTSEIEAFRRRSSFKDKKPEEPLFTCEYGAYLKALKIASHRALKKHITPHALRHSSATYYARKLDGNLTMIADRYGWAYNSAELALYIRRSGAYQRQQAKVAVANRYEEVAEENKTLRDAVEQLQRTMDDRLKLIEALLPPGMIEDALRKYQQKKKL